MKTLTWQKPGQQNVAQELIKIIINYVAELRNNINGLEGNPGILRWTMELVALAKKVRGKYILTYRFIAYLGMGYIICEICV